MDLNFNVTKVEVPQMAGKVRGDLAGSGCELWSHKFGFAGDNLLIQRAEWLGGCNGIEQFAGGR